MSPSFPDDKKHFRTILPVGGVDWDITSAKTLDRDLWNVLQNTSRLKTIDKNGRFPPPPDSKAIWVNKNQPFAKVTEEKPPEDQEDRDEYHKNWSTLGELDWIAGSGVNKKGETFESEDFGYLIASKGEFEIFCPLLIAREKMQAWFCALPGLVESGGIPLGAITSLLQESGVPEELWTLPDVTEIKVTEPELIPVAQGRKPIKGKDAKLLRSDLLKNPDEKVGESGGIDPKSRSPWVSVKEDDLLWSIQKEVPSEPGLNVLGGVISIPAPKTVLLNISEGVKETDLGEVLEYRATRKGVIERNSDNITVHEVFPVSGDVDFSVGNIRTDLPIEIKGNVLSDFVVDSASHITIGGTVENGAHVRANGNIIVQGGILGERTRIGSGGSVEASFVQEAEILARGMVRIHNSVLNAHILSWTEIHVLGEKLGKRSSVQGGTLNAREKMLLHSAGSELEYVTKLIAGVDELIEERLNKIKVRIKEVKSRIVRWNRAAGIDLQKKDAIERIQKMPTGKKKMAVDALKKIKQDSSLYQSLQRIEKKLESSGFKECENSVISVEHQLNRGVRIRMLHDRHIVTDSVAAVKISLIQKVHRIRIRPLIEEVSDDSKKGK